MLADGRAGEPPVCKIHIFLVRVALKMIPTVRDSLLSVECIKIGFLAKFFMVGKILLFYWTHILVSPLVSWLVQLLGLWFRYWFDGRISWEQPCRDDDYLSESEFSKFKINSYIINNKSNSTSQIKYFWNPFMM